MLNRILFWVKADRIGPDIPLTHWLLHWPSLSAWLCKKKFKTFHRTASFRPGAYAVNCSKIELSQNVVIRPQTMLFADGRSDDTAIEICEDVLLGSGVHIYTANHQYRNTETAIYYQGWTSSEKVTIKKGAWIGANVTILPGVTIGVNSVVAAGSVVNKSIPDKVVAGGIPAKIIKEI